MGNLHLEHGRPLQAADEEFRPAVASCLFVKDSIKPPCGRLNAWVRQRYARGTKPAVMPVNCSPSFALDPGTDTRAINARYDGRPKKAPG